MRSIATLLFASMKVTIGSQQDEEHDGQGELDDGLHRCEQSGLRRWTLSKIVSGKEKTECGQHVGKERTTTSTRDLPWTTVFLLFFIFVEAFQAGTILLIELDKPATLNLRMWHNWRTCKMPRMTLEGDLAGPSTRMNFLLCSDSVLCVCPQNSNPSKNCPHTFAGIWHETDFVAKFDLPSSSTIYLVHIPRSKYYGLQERDWELFGWSRTWTFSRKDFIMSMSNDTVFWKRE